MIGHVAAVCFSLWVVIGFQVSAMGRVNLFSEREMIPLSECQYANQRTDTIGFSASRSTAISFHSCGQGAVPSEFYEDSRRFESSRGTTSFNGLPTTDPPRRPVGHAVVT